MHFTKIQTDADNWSTVDAKRWNIADADNWRMKQ